MKTKQRKGFRKITVGGVVYDYKIGSSFTKFYNPDGKGFTVSHKDLTGMPWDSIERAECKGYFSITPVQIANYIEGLR